MKRTTALAAAALLTLTACSGPKLYNYHLAGNYEFTQLMAAHGGKEMKLEVIGDPFGVGEDALTTQLAAAMNGRNLGLPITFTATPTDPSDASTRMVAVFDPPVGTLPSSICSGALPENRRISEGTVALGYCRGPDSLSSLWVDLPHTGAGLTLDGAFDSALITMLPQVDPGGRGNRDCSFDCS